MPLNGIFFIQTTIVREDDAILKTKVASHDHLWGSVMWCANQIWPIRDRITIYNWPQQLIQEASFKTAEKWENCQDQKDAGKGFWPFWESLTKAIAAKFQVTKANRRNVCQIHSSNKNAISYWQPSIPKTFKFRWCHALVDVREKNGQNHFALSEYCWTHTLVWVMKSKINQIDAQIAWSLSNFVIFLMKYCRVQNHFYCKSITQ